MNVFSGRATNASSSRWGDLFLVWRVEDIGFFNGILHNLAHYENLDLKIDLDVADQYFDKDNKDRELNIPVAKLSLAFG